MEDSPLARKSHPPVGGDFGAVPVNLSNSPRAKQTTELAVFDGTSVKFVQTLGRNRWHIHDYDEGFYLIDGEFALQFESSDVAMMPGDFFIVRRGLRHRGVSEKGASLLRFERRGGATSVQEE
jgi:mannose-6-phosphate isomerase-like protein (cupin superfamily)